uniref:Uncharacterized protein n=1 Tax=viral metagenome TaxID=1070528 RepID=A0A6M3M0S8_9ZZZZ
MKKREYRAKKGSRLSNKRAKIYGSELDRIGKNYGGVTPKLVVKEARLKASPLHDYFLWDNNKAAKLHREQQARILIDSIVVEIVEVGSGEMGQIRAFHNVKVIVSKEGEEEKRERRYISIEQVTEEPDYHQQIIDEALRELKGWRQRYKQYKELTYIVEALDAVLEEKREVKKAA